MRGNAFEICYSRLCDFTWERVWEYSQSITDWRSVCVGVRRCLDDCVKAGIGGQGVSPKVRLILRMHRKCGVMQHVK